MPGHDYYLERLNTMSLYSVLESLGEMDIKKFRKISSEKEMHFEYDLGTGTANVADV